MHAVILVTGATGLLGGFLCAELRARGVRFAACSGPTRDRPAGADLHPVDVTDPASVAKVFGDVRPDAVIHAAVFNAADCARDPARAALVNVTGSANIAKACVEVGARLVHVSTDQVFDGEAAPYDERAARSPTSVYGRTKAEAEDAVLARSPDAIVARMPLLFGPTRNARLGFFDHQLASLREKKTMRLFDDEWRTPLSLRVAAEWLVTLAASPVPAPAGRVLHLGGPERMSRYEMGSRVARVLGLSETEIEAHIERASRTTVPGEPRPRDLSLDTTLFHRLYPGKTSPRFEDEVTRTLERNAHG